MPRIVGETVDQLITLEIKNRGMPHGILGKLYQAARAHAGDRPIAMAIAETLQARCKAGDVVLVLTGAGYLPTMPKGESDGPPGAVALARALHRGLGVVPIYVCEPNHADVICAASQAIGVSVRTLGHAIDQRMGAGLVTCPPAQSGIADWTRRLLDDAKPVAVIGTERLGPGRDGAVYAARGLPLSGPNAINEGLIDISGVMVDAAKRGALTVGIGDHGNEIGFGAIRDAVVAAMPHGEKLATVVGADLVLPAMCSNWGCYGIEACLAFLLQRPDLMHGPDVEERVLRRAFDAGVLEASYFSAEFLVDGLDGETSVSVVQILGNIVRKNLEPPAGYAGRR